MTMALKFGFSALVLTGLMGCASSDPVYNFRSEAGSTLDEGGFGLPTMQNHLVMTGQQSFAIDLSGRFAQQVPTTINFAFNSADLDAFSRATLDEQAKFIRQFPEVRFRVYGHTDLVGSNAANRALGLRRANAVVGYLSQRGISRNRLEAVVSFGETQPIVVSADADRRNRRTVTEVSGFVENHPHVLQGKYAQIVYREYVASATAVDTLTGNGSEFRP